MFHLVSVFFGVMFSFGAGRKDGCFCLGRDREDFLLGEGSVDTGGKILLGASLSGEEGE